MYELNPTELSNTKTEEKVEVLVDDNLEICELTVSIKGQLRVLGRFYLTAPT